LKYHLQSIIPALLSVRTIFVMSACEECHIPDGENPGVIVVSVFAKSMLPTPQFVNSPHFSTSPESDCSKIVDIPENLYF